MPLYPPAGGSFNPHSPGPIGDITPNTIECTVLSCDGALTVANGASIFNADFSGQLANGNIAWDTTGNIQMIGALDVVFADTTLGGNIIAGNLPTSDPNVFGELWTNLGIVTQSQG